MKLSEVESDLHNYKRQVAINNVLGYEMIAKKYYMDDMPPHMVIKEFNEHIKDIKNG